MESEPMPTLSIRQRVAALLGRLIRREVNQESNPESDSLDLVKPLKEAFGEDAVRKEDGEIIVDF